MNKRLYKITSIGLGIVAGLYMTYNLHAKDITQKPENSIETIVAGDCGCSEKTIRSYDNKAKNDREKDNLVYSLKERIKNKTIERDRIIQEEGRIFYVSPEGRLFESVPCPGGGGNRSLNPSYFEALVIA